MTESVLVKTILCPATRQVAKLVDKFIGIMCKGTQHITLVMLILLLIVVMTWMTAYCLIKAIQLSAK